MKYKRGERVGIYETVTWSELEVGDIVYLKKNEYAPADLLILDAYESKV